MLRPLIRHTLPLVPRPIVGRVACRYVAGETLDEGLDRVEELNRRGLKGTLALLGEEVAEEGKALAAVDEYTEACRRIKARRLDSGISIKLTLLGLEIDPGFCRQNLERVVSVAAKDGLFVRIDMEDHHCTDRTLEMYREAQARHGNLGIVLQSHLRRTVEDVGALDRGTSVRLCKGIYVEPESVAYQSYDEVRESFVASLERLFEVGATVGIATHDRYLVDRALEMIERGGVGRDRYEFQTLLGVTEDLRDQLRDAGHAVRVYVPYGRDWYEYSIRRLRENPQIAIYVVRAFLRAGR